MHPVYRTGFRSLLADSATFLFVAFIAMITALFLVLEGLGVSQRGDIFSADDKILIVSNGIAPRYMLPERYVDQIRNAYIPGVSGIAAINFVPATLSGTSQGLGVIAADPASILKVNSDLVVWPEMARRWIDDRNGVLMGRDLALRRNFKVGDSISISSPMFRMATGGSSDMKLNVQALYDIKDDAYPSFGIIINDKLIRPSGQKTAAQGLSSIMILLSDRKLASIASTLVDTTFARSPVPTRTSLREEYVEAFNDQGAGLSLLIRLYGLAGVVTGLMLLGTFCYYNARRLETTCRRLRDLGFRRFGLVTRLALVMAAAIVIGCAFGAVLTLVVTTLFETLITQNFRYFSVSFTTAGIILGITGVVAFALAALSFHLVNREPMHRRSMVAA